MATIVDVFGGGANITNGILSIPVAAIAGFDTATADGEKTLAALIKLTYDEWFSNSVNNSDTSRVNLNRSIVAPVDIEGVEKIEFTFSYNFRQDWVQNDFNPSDF
jgi:hypothetical protein